MRWKINKLGFLNFWLYDQEEFPLHDGHILLRGNNAAGKSITTQSFIPFLLDGDRRPERLDPFGSRDRKMEFYLLGDNEREESTGYLYLEFRKSGLEEYRTIGVGMRAQRGKGIDFWGFCLADGRRIGQDGFQLYEKVEQQNLPLSKQKLRRLIGDSACWAESQTRYKEMVNAQIFGFRDIRQYDQLVQLLISVRAPKLSKDFHPTAVKKLLNESLQVLTDEDLSAMVSTMEQMDNLEDTLHSYQTAIQDARIISREYTRYNQYILGQKGQACLTAWNRTRSLRQQLQDEEARKCDLEKKLEEQRERQKQSGICLEAARAQRLSLGEDELSAKQERLQQEREACADLEKELRRGEEQFQKMKDGIDRREARLRQLKRDEEDARGAVRLALRELEEQNEQLELGEEHKRFVERLRAERPEEGEALVAALRQRERQIGAVLDSLRRTDAARIFYDTACQDLDRAEEGVREAGIVLRDAQAQEREERDNLLEEFARRRDGNRELDIPQEIWLELRRALASYRVPADWSPIRNRLDECARKVETVLRAGQLRAEQAASLLKKEQSEAQRQLRQLKDQPEPIPPRREEITATRIQLAMRGIPCAPLYELVDFAPDLPQDRRDLLEAQLLDAGLLDALVLPGEHLPEVQELLAEYPDRFLVPGPPVTDPVTGLIPDAAGRFPLEAAVCLSGISQTDLNAETALLPDGRFRCGMLRGHSRAEGPAGFIGAAARAANRQRQLRELEEQLDRLEEKLRAARAEEAECAARLEQLELERSQMPTAEELDQALALLEQARSALRRAEEEQERRREAAQQARQAWAALDEESRSRSTGLPYERTTAAYEEAREAAIGYREAYNLLKEKQQTLGYARLAMESEEETIDEQREQAEDKRCANEQLHTNLAVRQAAAQALQDFLDRPENQARARRLTELEEEISFQDSENRDAEIQCARLEEQVDRAGEVIQGRKESLTRAVLEEQDLETYFREDLELGFSGLDGTLVLEEQARQAAGKAPASARGRTTAEMGEAISSNFQRYRGSLSGYHPEIKMVFDAPDQPAQLRQRYVITLKKGGRELSLYAFIQALQTDIDTTGALLEDRDRELFENILTETISHTLRARIEESAQWTRNMTGLMATLTTSMGLTFSLDWKEKKSEGEGELDTAQLVTLLNKDRALLTPEDSQKVSSHFRSRVKRAREEARLRGEAVNYADLIRGVLDYRGWYEFHLFYQRGDSGKKELNDRVFNRFSGGEKAMAMYVPLFASVSAQYLKGGDSCPRMLALDEAFAGVDDQNISAMFELMGILEFDYILNSQVLWGCYACVSDLNIAEMHHPANSPVVTILHYHWNGKRRSLEEGAR